MPLSLKIFINYRRDDRPELVKKIHDGFVVRYGKDNVFMDLDIPNFASFPDHLQEKVGVSNVLVACVGPKWLSLLEERASLTEPDYLVGEIKQALGQQHSMVASICIDGAEIPPKSAIPAEIQDMLDYQIPHFEFGDGLLVDIGKVMDDIEREYERRGLESAGVQELDTILRLPHGELEHYVFGLLEDRNELRVEKHLRDFPTHFLDEMSKAVEYDEDLCKSLLNSISVFGITFAAYDRLSLFKKFMHAIYSVFERTSIRHSIQEQNYGMSKAIGFEILHTLYLMGAILIRERKFDWMPELLCYSAKLENERNKSWPWILYLQHEGVPLAQESNRLLMELCEEIGSSQKYAYILRQFANDDEQLKDSVSQFDLVFCLDVAVRTNATLTTYAWPYFGIFYFDRISPILILMITDTRIRSELFGKEVPDDFLAQWIVRYCTYARTKYQGKYLTSRWRYPIPNQIESFIERHLPEPWRSEPQFHI